MNKEQFTNYLQNPENLNADSVVGLTEIVNRFPYCQSAHLLLTINLFKEENILYNASLKTTAVYAGNRRVLKHKLDQLAHKNKLSVEPEPVEEEKAAGSKRQTTKQVDDPVEPPQDKEKTGKEIEPEKTKQELLDEFIKKQPSISRGKESFFSAETAAKKSIVDQENIVSETLAKIYFDQHYFEKAINIYEKLSLKYPEKSIYFAALIEKAKKEIKT
jgi:hypothetical protein